MKENPEVNYVPTMEGLKALYEYHGEAMGVMFESIFAPSAPKVCGKYGGCTELGHDWRCAAGVENKPTTKK